MKKNKYESNAEKFFSNAYYSSDIKDKIKFYTISIKLKPSFIDAYFNRAELYKELGEYNKSIADYNKILELNPKDKDCYNNRAIVYYLIKNYDKSLQDLDVLVSMDKHYKTYILIEVWFS